MNKHDMERIWRKPGVQQISNLCRWGDDGIASAGERRNIQVSSAVLAWRKKTLPGQGFPPWNKSFDVDKPICPDWLRKRYRLDCPRNANVLIESYGKTYTKYDAREKDK